MTEPIALYPYDPQWPELFRREREIIVQALGNSALMVEHMGSTSIPDLPAKPIVDIIVLVASLDDARRAIPSLEADGYSFWRDNPDKTKLYLAKGLPPAPRRTHNLHIHDDMDEVRRHLLFRDHLRNNPDARAKYLALKRDLAVRFRDDREAYSKQKTAFIDDVVLALGGPARTFPFDP